MSRTLFLGLALALAAAPARADEKPAPKPIDVVICLDVSNSMDGLIASAKQKLWDIVNDLAKAQPTPDLRVALYSYGNTGYDPKAGWVRKDLDLTSDLDEVYRKLTGLTTNGGDEYVARVCRDALKDQKWSPAADALKIILVCGNEPASQDPQVKLAEVAAQAKKQGVFVNPIYCGGVNDADAADWKQFALMSGGRFAHIDQNRGAVAIATPFDKELAELSGKLNTTYLAFGKDGKAKAENQSIQDLNAAAVSPAAAAGRAVAKSGALYRNATWDLVDRCKEDPKFDVTKLPAEELPEEMKALKLEERAAYVKKKAGEREAVQKQIGDLTAKREAFVQEYQKKHPSAADQAFDAAVRAMLREQASAKGVKIP
jgi:hypothetical protein